MRRHAPGRMFPAVIVAGLSMVAAACGGAGANGSGAGDRPDILFVFSDDHAAHALSAYREHLAYGAELPETPGLDPNELQSMYDDPRYADVVPALEARLVDLRAQYDAPDVDPVPHREFVAPPGPRRPGAASGG